MRNKHIWVVAMIILFIIVTPHICTAKNKSDKLTPTWIKNPPQQLNNTYSFKVVETDAGSNLTSARKHSQKELIRSIEREFNIKVSDVLEFQSITHYKGGKTSSSDSDIYTLKIESDDADVNIYYERIDEYYYTEHIGGNVVFKLYTLYAVASPGIMAPRFDNFSITNKYGARGVWRSLIVPGWGQLYKGSKAKGGLILGGAVALVGGIITTESLRGNYSDMMYETHDVNAIRTYSNKADNMTNIRNICIGGAVALYVYSLIDAAVAPGAKRVIVKNKTLQNFSLTPIVSPEISGLALGYKF